MLDLEELVFRVNTKELEAAVKALDAVAVAVTNLNKPVDANVTKTAKAAKAQSEAAEAASKAALAQTKLEQAQSKTASTTEKVERATKTSTDALQRQQDVLNFMTQGFSKGQASTLAYAKASGLATDALGELGKVLERQRTLMGTDPFDKSIGAMKALKNETTVLREVNRLYNQGLSLTKKQMEDLAREKLRVIEAGKIEGKTFSEIRAEVYAVSQAIKRLATEDNKLSAQMKASQKEATDRTKALAFLEDQLEKTTRAVAETNSQLNRSASNSLVSFERALKKSGLSLDEQAVKLAAFKKNLQALNAASGDKQVDYLSRALGPQITDIAVGLATGQSPLMVLLQQGGQLRDQFALAGVAGADMGKMLTTAAGSMVKSVKDVAVAVGGLFINSIKAGGAAVVKFGMDITGQQAVLDGLRNRMLAMGGLDGPTPKLVRVFSMAAGVISGAFGTALLVAGAALISFGVALNQVIKQENELAKALTLTGGSLGFSQQAAIDYAKSLASVDQSTSQVIEVITLMAKEGGFAFKEIETVTKSAIQMQKYLGVSIEDTVKAYAKMKEDPVKNLLELAKATGQVSEATLESVIELQKQGKESEATAVAIKALADVNKTQVDRMKADYNGFSLFMIELGSSIKKFYDDTFKSLFYKASPKEQIKEQIAAINEILQGGGSVAGVISRAVDKKGMEEKLAILNKQLFKMQEIEDADRIRTEQQSKQAGIIGESLKLESQYQSEVEKHKTKILSIEGQIKAARAAGLKGTETEARLLRALAGEQDRLKKALESGKKSGAGSISIESDNTIANIEKRFGIQLQLAKNYAKDELMVLKAQADSGLITQDEYYTKTVGLITTGESKQLDVINQYTAEYEAALEKRAEAAYAALQGTYAKNRGTKDEAEKNAEAFANYDALIRNLANSYQTFKERADAVREALKSSGITREAQAAAKLQKAIEDAATASRKYSEESAKITEDAQKQNRELDQRMDLLGKTEEEQKQLNRQWSLQNKLTEIQLNLERRLREIRADKKLAEDPMGQFIAEQEAIQAAKEQRIAANKEVAVSAAEDFDKEFRRIRDSISDSIVTALFEGGKAGRKKLRDLIVAELRKPITLVINAMVNTVLGRALSSMGISVPGISDSVSMSGMGSGSLAGSWNSFASSSTGSSLGLSNFDDIAGYMPTDFSAAVGEFAGMVDSYGGYVGAFGAALEGDYGKAIGSAIGQYFGGPIGAWIGGELGSMLGLTDDSGTLHTGAGSSFSRAGGLSKINPLGTEYGAGTQAITDQVAQGVVGILDSVATSFGNEAGYSAATAFADDTSKDGAWGSLVISKLGGSVLDWADTQTSRWAPKEFADGEAGAKEYMQAVATSVRDVLIEEVPDWADAMLTGLGDSVTMEALATTVAQIGQIQSSFEALGISTEGIDVAKLGALFGSVDNFIAATNNFYDKFGTSSQKLDRTTQQLKDTFDELGMEIPTSTAAYYDLVTGLDLTTESGREAYQALLASGDAFLYVQDAATQAALSMQDAWARVLASRNGNAAQFSAQAQIDNAWSAFEDTGNRFGIGAPDWFKTITYDDFQNYTQEEQQLISQILDGYAQLNKAVETTTDTVTDSGNAANDVANARKDALNAAYSALEKSVNAQISIVQKQYDLAKAVYEVAISAVRELRGQVATTATMQANQGQSFIVDALAKAQADGSLPDSKKLSEAIGAVRASIDSTAFATKVEQDKAKILLSNDLQALADIAGPQMTTAELQLVELQGILTTAKEQLNVLLGVNDSILSVADALNAWQAAMAGGGTTSGGSSGSGTGSAGTSTSSSGSSGGFVTGGGGTPETRTIEQQIADLEAAGIPYHVSNLLGQIVVSRASSFENQHRIPGYANGGAFTNGIVQKPTMFNTAQMGEAGSEAIMPLSNIGGSLGVRATHDPALRDAVLELNANIEGLRAEVRADVSHNAKTARLLDRVIPDGQSINVTGNIDGGTV